MLTLFPYVGKKWFKLYDHRASDITLAEGQSCFRPGQGGRLNISLASRLIGDPLVLLPASPVLDLDGTKYRSGPRQPKWVLSN